MLYITALTIRRQLAQDNPPAYLPDVAMTLNNLALLALTQGDVPPSQAWIGEALTINRDLWQNNPSAHGDSFAMSLALKVMLLEHVQAEAVTLCELLHDIVTVVYSDRTKQWAQAKIDASCGQGSQP